MVDRCKLFAILNVIYSNVSKLDLMRNRIGIMALSLIVLFSSAPDMYAQRHDSRREQHSERKVNGNRHSGNSAGRDKNNEEKKAKDYSRPGRRPNSGKAPAKHPSVPVAPSKPQAPHPGHNSNHHNGNNHNGNHHNGGYKKPSHQHRPNRPVAPSRPVSRPPMRPSRPVVRPWHRPVAPHAWRPTRRVPFVRALFGLSFGMVVNQSLQQLRTAGYSIDGYDDKLLYLNNIREFGYLWPEGVVSYVDGYVARTQLFYSTPGYNRSRYNSIYSQLSRQYGVPLRSVLPGNGMQATWFASDGSYIQLEFSAMNTYGSGSRYFTTLTFGN